MPLRIVILVSLAIVVGGSVPLLAGTIPCETDANTECTTAPTCQTDGTCSGEPANEGQPCTQEATSGGCMTNPVCKEGVCTGTVAAPNGTECHLAGFEKCSTAGQCLTVGIPGFEFSFCMGATSRSCPPPPDDPCKQSFCNPQTGNCDVGDKCFTFSGCEVCNAGTCSPVNLNGPCTNPDGDFNPCTTNDRCVPFSIGALSESDLTRRARMPAGVAAAIDDALQVGTGRLICMGVPGGGTGPTPTPTVIPTACSGDCDDNQEVSVGEVVTMANITLETEEYSQCERGDADGDGVIRINDIVIGVDHALHGCPG